MSEQDPRTNYEAKAELRHAQMVQEAHERLYRRLAMGLNVMTLAGTLAATAGLAGRLNEQLGAVSPAALTVGGVLILVAGVISTLSDIGGHIWQHCNQKKRYSDLIVEADKLTLEKLDARMALIEKDDPPGIVSLELPIYNRVLRMLGYESRCRRLGPVEWLVSQFA